MRSLCTLAALDTSSMPMPLRLGAMILLCIVGFIANYIENRKINQLIGMINTLFGHVSEVDFILEQYRSEYKLSDYAESEIQRNHDELSELLHGNGEVEDSDENG